MKEAKAFAEARKWGKVTRVMWGRLSAEPHLCWTSLIIVGSEAVSGPTSGSCSLGDFQIGHDFNLCLPSMILLMVIRPGWTFQLFASLLSRDNTCRWVSFRQLWESALAT